MDDGRGLMTGYVVATIVVAFLLAVLAWTDTTNRAGMFATLAVAMLLQGLLIIKLYEIHRQ